MLGSAAARVHDSGAQSTVVTKTGAHEEVVAPAAPTVTADTPKDTCDCRFHAQRPGRALLWPPSRALLPRPRPAQDGTARQRRAASKATERNRPEHPVIHTSTHGDGRPARSHSEPFWGGPSRLLGCRSRAIGTPPTQNATASSPPPARGRPTGLSSSKTSWRSSRLPSKRAPTRFEPTTARLQGRFSTRVSMSGLRIG